MADLGTAISPAPAVSCLTTGGVVATGYSGNVTVALSVNPTGATLGGTLTVAASSGVATFSDLTLNRSGKNFKLTATASGLRTATSAFFSIPTECVFTTQPSAASATAVMSDVVVQIQDSAGNIDTEYTGNVTVAIYTSTAAGVLSGTTTVAAVAGVATFSTLSVSLAGTYTLIATASAISTAYDPASVVSDSFNITNSYVVTAGHLPIVPGQDIYGYSVFAGYGSLAPTTYIGNQIVIIPTLYIPAGTSITSIGIAGDHTASPIFTSIQFDAQPALLSASATVEYVSAAAIPYTSWSWSGVASMTSETSYALVITA